VCVCVCVCSYILSILYVPRELSTVARHTRRLLVESANTAREYNANTVRIQCEVCAYPTLPVTVESKEERCTSSFFPSLKAFKSVT
jgi:hypothetical protein